jgi:hypothetical protein
LSPASSTAVGADYRSRRRCALCFHFNNDWSQKNGQIAHLDQDPTNCDEDNLAYLCLPHHDEYDTERRQTKNLTEDEAKMARAHLYAFFEAGGDPDTAGRPTDEKTERKDLLQQARDFIEQGARQGWGDLEFRKGLGTSAIFYRLRPHLSRDYIAYFSDGRGASLFGHDGLTAIPGRLLDELERLEKEWGLM